MSSNFKTPLSVYVLYDKDNTKGSETYEKIYHLLCRNSSRPFEDGLDIPVFFRTDMANQITPIDINFSNKTIAILSVIKLLQYYWLMTICIVILYGMSI